MLRLLLFLVLFPGLGVVGWAADLVLEQSLAREIERSKPEGKVLRLNVEGQDVLALHSSSHLKESNGGVVILHGGGAHADSNAVINPLRTRLPGRGWETLSVQMPVASAGAAQWVHEEMIPQAIPRIRAAMDFFRQNNIDRLVLVGHGLGARMAMEYLGQAGKDELLGVVAISLYVDPERKDGGSLGVLRKVISPILDLYGSRDIEPVLITVRDRATAVKVAGNQRYRQDRMEGADHFFLGLEGELVSRVHSWMMAILTR